MDNYSLFLFFYHVIVCIFSQYVKKLLMSSASPSILINFFKVATYLSCGEDY